MGTFSTESTAKKENMCDEEGPKGGKNPPGFEMNTCLYCIIFWTSSFFFFGQYWWTKTQLAVEAESMTGIHTAVCALKPSHCLLEASKSRFLSFQSSPTVLCFFFSPIGPKISLGINQAGAQRWQKANPKRYGKPDGRHGLWARVKVQGLRYHDLLR